MRTRYYDAFKIVGPRDYYYRLRLFPDRGPCGRLMSDSQLCLRHLYVYSRWSQYYSLRLTVYAMLWVNLLPKARNHESGAFSTERSNNVIVQLSRRSIFLVETPISCYTARCASSPACSLEEHCRFFSCCINITVIPCCRSRVSPRILLRH